MFEKEPVAALREGVPGTNSLYAMARRVAASLSAANLSVPDSLAEIV